MKLKAAVRMASGIIEAIIILFLPNLSHKLPVTNRAKVFANPPTMIMKPTKLGSNPNPPS